jgi:hypothetical protein
MRSGVESHSRQCLPSEKRNLRLRGKIPEEAVDRLAGISGEVGEAAKVIEVVRVAAAVHKVLVHGVLVHRVLAHGVLTPRGLVHKVRADRPPAVDPVAMAVPDKVVETLEEVVAQVVEGTDNAATVRGVDVAVDRAVEIADVIVSLSPTVLSAKLRQNRSLMPCRRERSRCDPSVT